MMRVLSVVSGFVAAFFRWWLGELVALVPTGLRDRLRSGGERLLLEDGQLYRLRGRKGVPLANAERASAKSGVVLALPRTDIVSRPTQLPLAAEENLREVVGFEMDRLTPFSREEVYYDCLVTKRDAKAGRLYVDVLLALRARVDALVDGLERQGTRIAAVDVATDAPGQPLGVNLLPQAVRSVPSRLGRVLAAALTAAAVMLLVVALQVPLQRKADYAVALDARVAVERTRVTRLHRLEEEIAGLSVTGSSAHDLKRESRLTLALLDQVTRLLPDDAWLTQLTVNEDRLDLAGFSPSSTKLITTFEESPEFAEAMFRAPVTQDPRIGLERFSFSMRMTREAGE